MFKCPPLLLQDGCVLGAPLLTGRGGGRVNVHVPNETWGIGFGCSCVFYLELSSSTGQLFNLCHYVQMSNRISQFSSCPLTHGAYPLLYVCSQLLLKAGK